MLLFWAVNIVYSQSYLPEGINYQAVVYDEENINPSLDAKDFVLRNQNVSIRFTIIEKSVNGDEVFKETHATKTDNFGLFSIIIGKGTQISSNAFSAITWGKTAHFLKVEIDKKGESNYINMGVQELWSVPYSLSTKYAENAGNGIIAVSDNGDGSITFDYQNGSKYSTPKLVGLTGPKGDIGLTGATGSQGISGSNGINGLDGKTVLNGTSDPISILGVNGDFYINTANNKLFGPKSSGAWPSGVSLIGSQGPIGLRGPAGENGTSGVNGTNGSNGVNGETGLDGKTLLSGALDPILEGANGDFYINTASNKLFGPKSSGAWPTGVSLIGAPGAMGAQGPAGNGFINGISNGEMMYWDGYSWVTLSAGLHGQTLSFCYGKPTWTVGGVCPGKISNLNCSNVTNNGNLTANASINGVNSLIAYTGGDGGPYTNHTVTSTGVLGLTASLQAGTFANGNGSLTFTITGTPVTSGTASFAINIGGKTCTLSRTVGVSNYTGAYPIGSIFCASGVTEIVDVTNPLTGKTWMDRNLGATQAATSSTDADSYGDLYQWGRTSDGHQCRNSATTSTLSSIDTPQDGSFITVNLGSSGDWRSPENDNLWQSVNGVNNPCPAGYRLPTHTELDTERLSWNSNDSQGAFGSPLKLTMSGSRNFNNGSLEYVGNNGFYWSSSVNSTVMHVLFFDSSDSYDSVFTRATGISVRCLKD